MIDAAFVDEGFMVTVNEKRETVRGVVITASMDTPAKAEAQHFMRHNGNFGCPFCLNSGENVSTETKKKSTVHVYPCKEYPLRTREGTIENVRDALKSEKPVSFLFLSSSFFSFFSFHLDFFFFFFFFFCTSGPRCQECVNISFVSDVLFHLGVPSGLHARCLSWCRKEADVAVVR